MNGRQGRFLVRALEAAPHEGPGFSWREIGEKACFDDSESYDIAKQLEDARLLRMDNFTAYLSPSGREEARRIKAESLPEVILTLIEQEFLLKAAEVDRGRHVALHKVVQAIGGKVEIISRMGQLGFFERGGSFGLQALSDKAWEAIRQIRFMRARATAKGIDGTQR